jgi:3-(3-hydroxy-phenyl)propionate hydroxylase
VGSYAYRHYPYRAPAECSRERAPVAIVGAGLAGPTLALNLALRGVRSVVLDEDDTVSLGSRSICQAKHTLEIWDRFGIASRMVEKGITWEQGEVYLRDQAIFRFSLQPDLQQKFPAFVNLQQYYVEEYLYDRCLAESAAIDMRFRHKVVGVAQDGKGATLEVETPDGRYSLAADYVVACDGVRSPVRHLLGLPFEGEVFRDQFLIADIRLRSELPKERRFWFYPPFHPTNSVLLHRQADNILRVDFQLGRDADAEQERKPENIDRRLRQMFGPEAQWDHEWSSVYTFSCRMMDRFVHGRVIFAGDAAHVVSPFGARGGNGAVADVDNLAWKLAAILDGKSPAALLDSYDVERRAAAKENILNSTRATDFITPRFEASRHFRDATLALAKDFPFARALINSGRLSVPTAQLGSPIDTPDSDDDWKGGPAPGRAMIDAPVLNGGDGWLIDHLGPGFNVLAFGDDAPPLSLPVTGLLIGRKASKGWTLLRDKSGVAQQRYDAKPGTTYLVRADRYVAGRWRSFATQSLEAALKRGMGHG